jgi:hypothetical protein
MKRNQLHEIKELIGEFKRLFEQELLTKETADRLIDEDLTNGATKYRMASTMWEIGKYPQFFDNLSDGIIYGLEAYITALNFYLDYGLFGEEELKGMLNAIEKMGATVDKIRDMMKRKIRYGS